MPCPAVIADTVARWRISTAYDADLRAAMRRETIERTFWVTVRRLSWPSPTSLSRDYRDLVRRALD